MITKIPNKIALLIVFTLAIFLGASFWLMGKKMDSSVNKAIQPKIAVDKKIDQKANICEIKAYTGEAKIRVWKDKSGILHVAEADLALLPHNGNTKNINPKMKIVDMTPDLDSKLSKTTQDKMSEIIIKGYAETCNGVALACLDYQDGIFRPHLRPNL
jgi:hypothetical protein